MKFHVNREAYELLRSAAVGGQYWEEWTETTEVDLDREVLLSLDIRRVRVGETLSEAIIRTMKIGDN